MSCQSTAYTRSIYIYIVDLQEFHRDDPRWKRLNHKHHHDTKTTCSLHHCVLPLVPWYRLASRAAAGACYPACHAWRDHPRWLNQLLLVVVVLILAVVVPSWSRHHPPTGLPRGQLPGIAAFRHDADDGDCSCCCCSTFVLSPRMTMTPKILPKVEWPTFPIVGQCCERACSLVGCQ